MQWNVVTRWALGCISFLRRAHKNNKNKSLRPPPPPCPVSLGTHVLKRESDFPVKLTL